MIRKKKSNVHLIGVPDGIGENGQHDNIWEFFRIDKTIETGSTTYIKEEFFKKEHKSY